ncbi:hypothetical protein JCM31826_00250 [Thermaurantimonas aggregans]|uniref:Bacterial surface antigen (D15) domain-containing protein n=1 Tax=Thermaurantimonas aggregans TaxID=2173829 RepID=A0A401XHR0_9FLAO|nr:hypothetical protein [Thermaurantimonas aggregans]MCX8149470.1 hypothetical protein [Thermaurantimonas aggregans]GCD76543.1 hypothetical protein JCM31826_00250 [Thermaurantimonas aggregans]
MKSVIRVLIVSLLMHPMCSDAQFYYGLLQQYGRNRVQYNQFDWGFYRFDRVDIYTYADNDNLPHAVATMAHMHLRELEAALDVAFDDRFQILLFNTLGDKKQSNNNLDINQPDNDTRLTRYNDRTSILLYFDGNLQNLERDLRAGIADVLIRYQIYGDLSAGGLDLYRAQFPDWFLQGLVSWFAYGDDPQYTWEILQLHSERAFRRINSLEPEMARLAGHGIWSYIVLTYGKNVIKNILFTSIVHKNLDFGIEYVLGISTKELIRRWNEYSSQLYKELGELQRSSSDMPLIRFRKGEVITGISFGHQQQKLAIATSRNGKKRVYLVDIERGKKKRIFRSGSLSYKAQDLQVPLIAWNPVLPILLLIDEKAGFIQLHFYDFDEKKWTVKPLYGVNKVYSATYSPDGEKLLLSAMKEGKSDVIEYTIRNTNLKKITSDIHADLWPAYISDSRWIAVATTRRTNDLDNKLKWTPTRNPLNIQYIDLQQKDRPELILQSTGQHIRPLKAGDGRMLFAEHTSDLYTHLYRAVLDSTISHVDTAIHYRYFFRNQRIATLAGIVQTYTLGADTGDFYYILRRKNRAYILRRSLAEHPPTPLPKKPSTSPENKEPERTYQFIDAPQGRHPDNEININDYQFDSRLLERYRYAPRPSAQQPPAQALPNVPSILGRMHATRSIPELEEVKLPPRRPYLVSFYRENVTFSLDNAFLVPQYQPFTGRPQPFLLNPQFNGMFKVGMADVLRDYRLLAGIRTELNPLAGRSLAPNHEIVLWLANHKKRWKHEYTFYRRSAIQTGGQPLWVRFLTHEAQYKAIFPLDEVRSLHLHPSYRLDSRITLARDAVSLQQPTLYQHFGILRASYVHDEALSTGVNLWRGFRWKVFTEYYRDLFHPRSGMHTAGIDARHYLPVWRSSIWANRFAVGTSFGPERLIHFLGGVDNTFVPRFDEGTPIAQSQNYIFQTLVTNMRGFFQNARNGNSFALLNSELRLPIFRMLLNRPIRNSFVSSMQIVLFSDVGTAWNGLSPLSPENAINQKIIDKGNLRIIIDSRKDPLIGSFGAGLRMLLFGHMVRIDWARGIEDYRILPRHFHFSLGFDF